MTYSELRSKAFVEGFSHNDDGDVIGVQDWAAVGVFLLIGMIGNISTEGEINAT